MKLFYYMVIKRFYIKIMYKYTLIKKYKDSY